MHKPRQSKTKRCFILYYATDLLFSPKSCGIYRGKCHLHMCGPDSQSSLCQTCKAYKGVGGFCAFITYRTQCRVHSDRCWPIILYRGVSGVTVYGEWPCADILFLILEVLASRIPLIRSLKKKKSLGDHIVSVQLASKVFTRADRPRVSMRGRGWRGQSSFPLSVQISWWLQRPRGAVQINMDVYSHRAPEEPSPCPTATDFSRRQTSTLARPISSVWVIYRSLRQT